MKIRWLCISVGLFLSACDLGPLSEPTPTPVATATSIPTLAPTATETSTAASTATFSVTETIAPTAVTCPKGTVLRPSLNKCFYATRTPKPQIPYCEQFAHKVDCINSGCSWNTKIGFCS